MVADQADSQNRGAIRLVQWLQRRGKLRSVLRQAAIEDIVLSYASQYGLVAEPHELQQAADRVRRASGLISAESTRAWLDRRGQSILAWEQSLEYQLLRKKVVEHVTCHAVPKVFNKCREQFEVAILEQIVVSRGDTATELKTQLDEGADFSTLGLRVGGHTGVRSYFRRELSPEIATAVFSGNIGDLYGPVSTQLGYHLICVRDLTPAQLDESTVNFIRNRLFRKWLRRELKQQKFTNPIFEMLQDHAVE